MVVFPLLAACDRRTGRDVPDAPGNSGPEVTRAAREPRPEPAGAEVNLRDGLDRAREIEAPGERGKALAEVAWNALEIDPGLASEAFGELRVESVERIRLIQHFAMRLAEMNPDEALKWADALGSDGETAAARCRIALVISDADPKRAADLLSESGIEGREFDVAVVQVLQRWAVKSPPDAMAWVALFPAGASRAVGMKTVVSQWASQDAAAVFAWMGKLADESLRHESVLAMTAVLAEQTLDVRESWLRHADPVTRVAIEDPQQTTGGSAPTH